MLSDEIVWCDLLVEQGLVEDEAKCWIHVQVVKEYYKRTGQVTIGELVGEVSSEG